MSEHCEVVSIDRDGQKVTINKSDLQDDDQLWQDDEATPKAGTVAWYKAELDAAEIEYPADANKKALKALLEAGEAD